MRALDLAGGPWIIGHRGAAARELENTLESVASAIDARAAMVEVDLRLTADGVIVVFHDATLERLAGRAAQVERATWRSLAAVELPAAGRAFTHRIPRLSDLLAAVPESQPLNLELKTDRARAAPFARQLVVELGSREQVLVSSFDFELLAAVARAAPDLPLAPISSHDPAALLAAGEELGAWSLHCRQDLAVRRLLDSPRRGGRPVLAYTVNRPARARTLLRRGVRGVFSDDPGAMLAALDRWPV